MPNTTKVTLGRLARMSGLARASLLNYEALGLLTPAGRNASGYRLYSDAEVERLETIRRLRDAGLSLLAIRDLIRARERPNVAAELLERRLLELSSEVDRLRRQQRLLARLLATPAFRHRERRFDKASWVDLLRRAGLSEDDMHLWHAGFETDDPRGHAQFLRTLGLPPQEVDRIRRWSRT